jgi:hypothetical protein
LPFNSSHLLASLLGCWAFKSRTLDSSRNGFLRHPQQSLCTLLRKLLFVFHLTPRVKHK